MPPSLSPEFRALGRSMPYARPLFCLAAPLQGLLLACVPVPKDLCARTIAIKRANRAAAARRSFCPQRARCGRGPACCSFTAGALVTGPRPTTNSSRSVWQTIWGASWSARGTAACPATPSPPPKRTRLPPTALCAPAQKSWVPTRKRSAVLGRQRRRSACRLHRRPRLGKQPPPLRARCCCTPLPTLCSPPPLCAALPAPPCGTPETTRTCGRGTCRDAPKRRSVKPRL